MPRCRRVLGFSLIVAASFSSTYFLTAQATNQTSSHVRPCSANESAVGASPEVTRLLVDERPTFNWCEAVDVPWLANAEILRFHTAIHVDYSYVVTIVKATRESPIRLIRAAGEGMVATPAPGLPQNLEVMNGLLRTVTTLNDSQLGSAGILYLFLIDREIRRSLFSKPLISYPLDEADYRIRCQTRGKSRSVLLRTQTNDWKLTFSTHKDGLHLDYVKEGF